MEIFAPPGMEDLTSQIQGMFQNLGAGRKRERKLKIRDAMKLVPDEVVQMITASGTPDECRAKVREYVAAGCTCPILYPLGDDVPAMIDAFAGGQF